MCNLGSLCRLEIQRELVEEEAQYLGGDSCVLSSASACARGVPPSQELTWANLCETQLNVFVTVSYTVLRHDCLKMRFAHGTNM